MAVAAIQHQAIGQHLGLTRRVTNVNRWLARKFGNGRFSRYLIHHCLGQSGRLPPQFLLPISVTMAEASLDTHMRQEVEFLGLFDRVRRHINERFDLRGSDLATLIVTIFQNGGTLSNNRRKRYADRVQTHVLDAVESAVARAMRGALLDEEGPG
jgi:hypothetical protein